MASNTPAKRAVTAPAKPAPVKLPGTQPCSKTFEFFKDVTVGPGEVHDSGTPRNVDCFQWLHVWVLARHSAGLAMDNITVQLVFELPGKMGATGLANLETGEVVHPTPISASSGGPVGGYGGFVIRAPIVGSAVRVIVINNGATTHDFTLWGYCTR